MHGMITDLRVAIRSLRRHRGFAVVCITALAIGIGASTAMFSILHAVALDPLPFPDQDRLVVGWKTSRVDRRRSNVDEDLDLIRNNLDRLTFRDNT